MDKFLAAFTIGAFFVLAIASCNTSHAADDPDLEETRYTTRVIRLADGSIRRRADVIAAYRAIHPCPSTMQFTGTCPGWSLNHVVPLACGGRDAVSNLMWLRNELKTCPASAGRLCVDRYERKIAALDPPVPDTINCINQLVR